MFGLVGKIHVFPCCWQDCVWRTCQGGAFLPKERMSSNFQLHQWSELLVSERVSKIWIHYLEKFPPLWSIGLPWVFYKTPNFHQFPWDIVTWLIKKGLFCGDPVFPRGLFGWLVDLGLGLGLAVFLRLIPSPQKNIITWQLKAILRTGRDIE